MNSISWFPILWWRGHPVVAYLGIEALAVSTGGDVAEWIGRDEEGELLSVVPGVRK